MILPSSTVQSLLCLAAALLHHRLAGAADDRAEVNIRVSGACSPTYLGRRGIELSKYRPYIRFNPDKIQLVPKNPVIPGCVKIKAEGVEILKPIRNLLAEVEMRIGGTPDPNNPPLPCTKKVDDKVNQCPCAKTAGSCVFCDFCRQMRSQSSRISVTESQHEAGGANPSANESLEESCKCETMQPGLYDIETEMCTPELEDAKQFIPPEIQSDIVQKTPVIDWLLLDDANLPYFLAMYFEQPDSSCHAEGPDSDLVKSGLIYVDSMINYLMYRLDKEGLLGCLNIVIVSDHGGQALMSSKFLPVDDYLPVEDDENMEVFGGAVGHLNFHDLAKVNATKLLDTFACKTNHSFRVFTKQTIPKRYHYTNSNRVGPVIFDGYPGARVFRTREDVEKLKDKGDHGYDNRNREMRAIFGGYGPDIREKTVIPPFQNIELYNLLSDLLRLPFSAPNNGTRGVLYNVLRRPPDVVETEVVELHPCENADLVKCGDGCYFKLDLIPHDKDAAADCQRLTPIDASQHTADTLDLCALDFCNATMAFSRRMLMPMFVESILTAPLQNIDHRANCSAWVRIRVPQNRILSPSNITMSSLFETDAAGEAEADTEENAQPSSTNDEMSNDVVTNWKSAGAQGRERRNQNAVRLPTMERKSDVADEEEEEEDRVDAAKLCLSSKASKGQRWISLFPDNDYTRYVVQGQIRVPTGFHNGPWKHMLDLIVKYQRHYKKIVMYAGPIFDRLNSGVADEDILHPRQSAYFDRATNIMRPTHIFLILLRCPGAKWQADFRACERTEDTSTLAFILPLIEKEDNCLFVEEYLFMNTCRIRDIELLTHLEWFTDRRVYSAETALRLRTAVPEQLWQLEVDARSVES